MRLALVEFIVQVQDVGTESNDTELAAIIEQAERYLNCHGRFVDFNCRWLGRDEQMGVVCPERTLPIPADHLEKDI